MAKKWGLPLGTFLKRFSSEAQCQQYLASQRWQTGYVCPKCGCSHGYRRSNGRYQFYLDEYSFRFCRRDFGPALLERLTFAVSLSRLAD